MPKEELGPYDSALQQYVEKPREADQNRLAFVKWLKENDRLATTREDEAKPEEQMTLPVQVEPVAQVLKPAKWKYDASLQQLVNPEKLEPAREHLVFLRGLAEKGNLEHEVAGPPEGEYAMQSVAQEGEPAA